MSFGVKDSLGNELSPGDIVIFGERWGRVSIGVVFDKVIRESGYDNKVRVKAYEDKGKATPWGNSRIKSLSIGNRGVCQEVIKLDASSTNAGIGKAQILSDYMAEKGKIVRAAKIVQKVLESDGLLDDLLSSLGAPKIR